MNKRVLIILMATLLPHFSYDAAETPLLPEVKKALEVPSLDEKEMTKNSYVYLLAIDAKDDNYFDIAKKYIIATNQWLQLISKNYETDNLPPMPRIPPYESIFDNKIDGKPFRLPCNAVSGSLIESSCVATILADKPKIMMLIKKNQKVLTRFDEVISLPNYHAYKYTDPVYDKFLFLSNLKLLQAVYAIDEGDINKGLDILQHQIDFEKKMLISKHLDSKLIIRSGLMRTYLIISDLLNTYPDLLKEPYLTKVRSLLSTLPNYNTNLKDAILNGCYTLITNTILLNKDTKQEAEKWHLTYNLNDTVNKIYLSDNTYIKFAQLTLPEIRTIYSNKEYFSYFKKCTMRKGIIVGDCDKDNQYGDTIAVGRGEYIEYLFYRPYDAYNYLALVNLQLDILSRGLKAEQVPELLSSSGDKALNIITQKPFIWNKENSTISTNYLTPYDKSRNPMSVKIKFNQ